MNSAVCTLFEGHYHYGLGALANSLYTHGFRGTIYTGYRGPLPPWAAGARELDGGSEFSPVEGLTFRFIPLTSKIHFTNYKPDFMLEVLRKHCLPSGSLFYFDPDIVIRCRWTFYEEWVECGVGLCQEIVHGSMPSDHPFRTVWKKLAESIGHPVRRNVDRFYNGGFVAVKPEHAVFLEIWRDLIAAVGRNGAMLNVMDIGDPTQPFDMPDQVCLNIATMVAETPLSTVGPEEMDFIPGGSYMSHPTGKPKPWQKSFLLALLKGMSPSRAERTFWRNTQFPIRLFPKPTFAAKQVELKTAALIGRLICRN